MERQRVHSIIWTLVFTLDTIDGICVDKLLNRE